MMETTKLGRWKSDCNRKECSECGFVYYAQRPEFKYCPSCGAKMTELLEKSEQLKKTLKICTEQRCPTQVDFDVTNCEQLDEAVTE